MDPQVTRIHADSPGKTARVKSANLHYKLAESCFSEKLLRCPLKSANLRNLRIETVHCFGCGPQAALCNLRMNWIVVS
jgi:hypothetical protein